MLLVHDALYAPQVRVCLLSLVSLMKLGFFFNYHTNGLDFLHGKASRASSPLEVIHSGIYRPMNVKACHGAIYFLTFIEENLLCGPLRFGVIIFVTYFFR